MSEVRNPFAIFLDLRGLALEDGYIYIGLENEDPETDPQATFWDAAMSIPATQPIRTMAGVPDRSGSPGKMFTDGKYSIRVRDVQGVQVYYSASEGETSAAAGEDYLVAIQFLGTPEPSDVISGHLFDRAVLFETDMPGAGDIETSSDPAGTYTMTLYLDGISKGTVAISTAGAVTFDTVEFTTAAGNLLTLVGPGGATTLVNIFGYMRGSTA